MLEFPNWLCKLKEFADGSKSQIAPVIMPDG